MKLLGEYSSKDADKYKDILLEKGIEAKLGFPEEPISAISEVRGIAKSSIYVPEEQFDKAVDILNDYEMKQIKEIKENNEKLKSNLSNIFFVLGVVLLALCSVILYSVGRR